ncbi:hypothetical protein ACFX13_012092 [Malus domestica]
MADRTSSSPSPSSNFSFTPAIPDCSPPSDRWLSHDTTPCRASVLLLLPPLAETGTFGPVPQQLLHCSALDHLDISNIVAPSLSNYDKLMAVNDRGMAA